jgi:hypothetical protein
VSRWSVGEAEVETLLTERALQSVTGSAADGTPGLARECQTLASAQVLLDADPTNALVLAYDAARQACTALLAQQGLRPTTATASPLGQGRPLRVR